MTRVLLVHQPVDGGVARHVSDLFDGLTRRLSRRERLILTLRFREDMTLTDIGRVVGITESRVSQMLAQLLGRLRAEFDGRRDELLSA